MARSKKTVVPRGKFIVFEGVDGSGTTTQNKLLSRYLEEHKWPVLTTSEPSGGPVGLMLRLILSKRLPFGENNDAQQKSLTDGSLALLFAADRLDHLQYTVLPRLQEGVTVICDRYTLSSFAYQMGRDRASLDWLRAINGRSLQPDLTIFLHSEVAVCDGRRQLRNRWSQELFEKNEILQQVSANYLYAIEVLRRDQVPIEIIDGNKPENLVFDDVLQVLRRKFPEFPA